MRSNTTKGLRLYRIRKALIHELLFLNLVISDLTKITDQKGFYGDRKLLYAVEVKRLLYLYSYENSLSQCRFTLPTSNDITHPDVLANKVRRTTTTAARLPPWFSDAFYWPKRPGMSDIITQVQV